MAHRLARKREENYCWGLYSGRSFTAGVDCTSGAHTQPSVPAVVIMRAQAKWLSQAFDCIDPLERSTYLANVRQSYAHLRELEGQVLIDFELRADLQKRPVKEATP